MSDPIEDYIRANRETYSRETLTAQMVASGHDRTAIEAAWARADQSQAGPNWDADLATKPNTRWGLLLLIVAGVVAVYVLTQQLNLGSSSPGTGGNGGGDGGGVPSTTVRVIYGLTGSATAADLTYTDGSGNIQQHANAAVPLGTTSGATGMAFTVERGSFVQFSAQNTGESGDLTCTITADGVVINTGHSSGGFTIVSCSATVP
jgi:hypothetical protein